MLARIVSLLQLDRPLVFALAGRIWQSVSGPVTIILLIRALSLAEQGVYYGLVNVVGIQAFFELGLLNILVAQAGHQSAAFSRATQSVDVSTAEAQRMSELIRSSRRWFSAASVCFLMVAIWLGWTTFSGKSTDVQWQQPLLCLVPIAAVSVALSPLLAILEGAGKREIVYRIRLWQMVTGTLAVWGALLAGAKLWALVVGSSVQVIWMAYLVFVQEREFFQAFRGLDEVPDDFSWIRDVVPMQWRIAIISVVYHLATQLFTVIVIRFHSEEAAAPLGMTISITGAIQMLALAWVQTKFSVISAHHSQGQREVAGTLWRRTALVSAVLLVVAFVVLGVIITQLPVFGRGLADRFVSPSQLAVLGVGCLANHLIALQGFYVLSRRANPLFTPSCLGFACTALAVWLGGYYAAVDGVVWGFALSTTFIALPLHTLAYLKFRQQQPALMPAES